MRCDDQSSFVVPMVSRTERTVSRGRPAGSSRSHWPPRSFARHPARPPVAICLDVLGGMPLPTGPVFIVPSSPTAGPSTLEPAGFIYRKHTELPATPHESDDGCRLTRPGRSAAHRPDPATTRISTFQPSPRNRKSSGEVEPGRNLLTRPFDLTLEFRPRPKAPIRTRSSRLIRCAKDRRQPSRCLVR